ncbi:ubiquitin thioesterase OTUB2 [Pyxicephalus adspersus]
MSFHLVSEKFDIDLFIQEHASEPLYQSKLKELRSSYCAVRQTCADGSCFYRGMAYAYLESLLGKRQEILRFRERVMKSSQELLAAGFPQEMFEHCHDAFLSIIDMAERDSSGTLLIRVFNYQLLSDNVVLYLRLITSAFLRNRADFYQPFVEEGLLVSDFCIQNVEPLSAVCDHLQISALTQALAIPLQVEYVDSKDNATNQHIFPEGAVPSIYLLYKQDHYAVLYRRSDQEAQP